MVFRPAAPTHGQEDDITVLTLTLARAGLLHSEKGALLVVFRVWFAVPCADEMRLHLGDESALGDPAF